MYPKALVRAVFDKNFETGARCNVCTIGVEPNPRHGPSLELVQKLLSLGAGVSTEQRALRSETFP